MPGLTEIGRKHAAIGISPHYYYIFGVALFRTVAQLQADSFNEEVALAWRDAYYLLAGLMKETAGRQPLPEN